MVRIFYKSVDYFLTILQIHQYSIQQYNSDKISIQISKETHKKLKNYCIDNELKMKDFIDEVILKSIKKPLK